MGARGGFLLLQPIFYGVHFPAPSSRLQESESSLHVPGLLPGLLGFRVLQGEMFLDLQGASASSSASGTGHSTCLPPVCFSTRCTASFLQPRPPP